MILHTKLNVFNLIPNVEFIDTLLYLLNSYFIIACIDHENVTPCNKTDISFRCELILKDPQKLMEENITTFRLVSAC